MASPNAALRLRLEKSPTYAAISVNFRDQWLKRCLRLGEARCLKPQDEEVFDSPDACFERLQDWVFSIGCFFVKGRHRGGKVDSREYYCKYHGSKLDNKRGLKDTKVRRDSEGKVISDRQRNTNTSKFACDLTYYISFRGSHDDDESGNVNKAWRGRWRVSEHKETCPSSEPLDIFNSFPAYRKLLDEYKDMTVNIRQWREGKMTYHQARALLASTGNMLDLDRKEYYNIIRTPAKDSPNNKTALALLRLLDDAGWKYRLRTLDPEDVNDDSKERKLVQIFFWWDEILPYSQRFTSDSLLYIDATFRTNQHGLPLMVAVGATNCNSTIPVAFSWCPEEDAQSYSFFAEQLREQIYKGIPDPAVVMANQGAGFTKAFANGCFPYSELQYYS